jgi:transcriptional regulator with PAS, ATPase and Fis domain
MVKNSAIEAMKVVCSYCRTLLGEKEPLEDSTVSHGICGPCFDHYAQQWDGQSTGEFLDRFERPVVVVDTGARVIAINRAMAELQGIEDRDAVNMLGGELMECEHARLPQGCGRTLHCKACALRRVVNDTVHTGEPQHHVPASLRVDAQTLDLMVSSYQRDGVVFLLIEPV